MTKSIKIPCTSYSIAADWYEGQGTQDVLLVLPGYTSSKARQQDFISAIKKASDVSVLAIDYSGHGESPFELKDTSPAQHALEAVYAYDWIKDHSDTVNISVAGSSYGGFIGAHLSKYREIKNLILRAPALYRPSDFYNLWAARLQNEELYRSNIERFRNTDDVRMRSPILTQPSLIKGETLVVVHDKDEVIPVTTTNAYISAYDADSYVAADFTHAVSKSPVTQAQLDEYYTYISRWLMKRL